MHAIKARKEIFTHSQSAMIFCMQKILYGDTFGSTTFHVVSSSPTQLAILHMASFAEPRNGFPAIRLWPDV